MKNCMKRVIALLCVLSMVLATGCANTAPEEQEKTDVSAEQTTEKTEESSEAGEKDTLTVLVMDNYVEDHETNYYTKVLEEKANVDLEFVVVSSVDFAQKLSLMINGGDELPDVIANYAIGDGFEYGSSGFYLPLNEYFDDPEKMPNFHKYVKEEDREYMLKCRTTVDGNLYTAPSYVPSEVDQYYYSRAWINVDWLEAVGKEMPTTTDELYEVLKAFKEEDPNGNGLADEIPMVAGGTNAYFGIAYLMNAFEYINYSGVCYMNVKDGQIYPAFATDAWRNGMAYIHKLVSEELFTPLSFTQDDEQFRAMVRNPEKQIVGCYAYGDYASYEGSGVGSFEPLPPMVGPDGTNYICYSPAGVDSRFAITRDCENVDAAVRLMDAFYDREVSAIARRGEPEVDWTTEVPEGYTIPLKGQLKEPGYMEINQLWGTTHNKHWTMYAPAYLAMDDPWSDNGKAVNESDESTLRARQIGKNVALQLEKGSVPEEQTVILKHTLEDKPEFADLDAAFYSYVEECITRFATGELSVEDDWDDYLKTLDDMGVDRYTELTQKAFDNSGLK